MWSSWDVMRQPQAAARTTPVETPLRAVASSGYDPLHPSHASFHRPFLKRPFTAVRDPLRPHGKQSPRRRAGNSSRHCNGIASVSAAGGHFRGALQLSKAVIGRFWRFNRYIVCVNLARSEVTVHKAGMAGVVAAGSTGGASAGSSPAHAACEPPSPPAVGGRGGAGGGSGRPQYDSSSTLSVAGPSLRSVADLAFFGGSARFVGASGSSTLVVGKPNLGNRATFDALVDSIWSSGRLTNDGPLVRQFEQRICDMLGVSHAVCVCNATLGLELVLSSLGLRAGGEVIVPSFTFVATAHAVKRSGFSVKFADVGEGEHHVTVESVEAAMTDNTVAVLPVHVWGIGCDVRGLEELCARRGVPLIFDAAHAFLCRASRAAGLHMIGGYGIAEVFSFHATKFFNCGEGGVITTNDSALAERLRLQRNFGFTGYDRVESAGTNAKMSELHAALGLTNLRHVDDVLRRNSSNFEQYKVRLDGLPGVTLLEPSDVHVGAQRNYQYVVLEIDAELFGISRDLLVRILGAEGIQARRYFYPGVHAHAPYADETGALAATLPHTVALCERVCVLPTGMAVDSAAVESICGLVWFMHSHAAEIVKTVRTMA